MLWASHTLGEKCHPSVPESVTWLYALNAILVGIDIYLCLYFRRREQKAA